MSIRAILFDLDGVLVDACEIHYLSLNKALKKIADIEISREDHLSTFNGLPTKKKLEILHGKKLIKDEDKEKIWKSKQDFTKETIIETLHVDQDKINLHKHNRFNKVKLACITNSITETTELMLRATGQFELMDYVVTNEMVNKPKPCSEGYVRAMVALNVFPEECIIVEDSPVGIQSAEATGANVWKVKDSYDVTLENFEKFIFNLNKK